MALLLAILLLPIAEIAGFILVGQAIGLLPTLLLVVAAAVAGMLVLRARAILTLPQFRAALASGDDPMGPIAHGALVALAGVLLLVPGFLTDAVGVLLLVPAVRRLVLAWLADRISVTVARAGLQARPRAGGGAGPAIETDYEVVDADPDPAPRRGESGWTRPRG